MRRFRKNALCCMLICLMIYAGTIIADKQRLRQEIVIYRIAADIPSSVKADIKSTLETYFEKALYEAKGIGTLKDYLSSHLNEIQNLLQMHVNGSNEISVTFDEEAISGFASDHFFLPTGIYQTVYVHLSDAGDEKDANIFSSDELRYELNNGAFKIRFVVLDMIGYTEILFA